MWQHTDTSWHYDDRGPPGRGRKNGGKLWLRNFRVPMLYFLNVGTVPMLYFLNVGTVPTSSHSHNNNKNAWILRWELPVHWKLHWGGGKEPQHHQHHHLLVGLCYLGSSAKLCAVCWKVPVWSLLCFLEWVWSELTLNSRRFLWRRLGRSCVRERAWTRQYAHQDSFGDQMLVESSGAKTLTHLQPST